MIQFPWASFPRPWYWPVEDKMEPSASGMYSQVAGSAIHSLTVEMSPPSPVPLPVSLAVVWMTSSISGTAAQASSFTPFSR